MPRYFFNVEDDRTIIDQEGTDLPNLRAAREEAVSTSSELFGHSFIASKRTSRRPKKHLPKQAMCGPGRRSMRTQS